MTLLLLESSSSSLDVSEDPFAYVPLGASKRKKLRKKVPEVVCSAIGTRRSKRIRKLPETPPESSPRGCVSSSSRCSACGMPWTCLKTFESHDMHKGFCAVRITRPEDRDLIPKCPQGRECKSTLALHYELKRHEHIQWEEELKEGSKNSPLHGSQEPPIKVHSPRMTPPQVNTHHQGFKTPGTNNIPSHRRNKKTKRLFSESEKPLFRGMDEPWEEGPSQNEKKASPSVQSHASHANSVVLPQETPSLQLESTATSHNVFRDGQDSKDSFEKPPDMDRKSYISAEVVQDYIQDEVERFRVFNSPAPPMHSTPLKGPSPPQTSRKDDDLTPLEEEEAVDANNSFLNHSIYKQFFEEEIQRNKEKTLTEQSRHKQRRNEESLFSDEISREDSLMYSLHSDVAVRESVPEDDINSIPLDIDLHAHRNNILSLKSGVQVSAKKVSKDGGIHLSLKVTDPGLKLQELKMNIPKAFKPTPNQGISRQIFQGKKQSSINDFFGGSSKPSKVLVPAPSREETHHRPQGRTYECPQYKRISQTSFVVDAFSYGYIPGVSIYFLSHFHRDHYIGLTRTFEKPIVCSRITASLLRMQLNVSDVYIRALDLNMERTVDGSGVTVTLLEANHCPGAVMFLFKFPDGTAALHTGDFRAVPAMEEYPSLWDAQIKRLYLDTTYCSPEHDFPAQDFVINKTVSIVKERLRRDPNTLVIVGTYTIGKERIFLAIAEELDRKIFPQAAVKSRILSVLEDEVLSRRLVKNRKNPEKSYIHIVSVKDARSVDFLSNYRRKFKCSSILSIVPTGWTRESASFKVNQRQPGIYCLEVPYSEHSSFSELKRFVQFINLDSSEAVVPTVNVGSHASRSRLKKIFQSWIEKEETPFRQLTASRR